MTVVTGHAATRRLRRRRLGRRWPARAGPSSCSWAWPTGPTIAERLLAAGRAPDTPVAVVHWGTTDRQQVRPVRGPTGLVGTCGARRPRGGPCPADHRSDGGPVARARTLGLRRARPAARAGPPVVVTRARSPGLACSVAGCAAPAPRWSSCRSSPSRTPPTAVRRWPRRRPAGRRGLRVGAVHLGQRRPPVRAPRCRDGRALGGTRLAAVGPVHGRGPRASTGSSPTWSPRVGPSAGDASWPPASARVPGGRRARCSSSGPSGCAPWSWRLSRQGAGGSTRSWPTGRSPARAARAAPLAAPSWAGRRRGLHLVLDRRRARSSCWAVDGGPAVASQSVVACIGPVDRRAGPRGGRATPRRWSTADCADAPRPVVRAVGGRAADRRPPADP